MDDQQRTLAEFGHVPGAAAQLRLTELEAGESDDVATAPNSDGESDETRPNWAPASTGSQYVCERCGNHVSPDFYRVWEVDGVLEACPECAPRSVRFGEDVYGRDLEDIDDFEKDDHNRGKDPGGVQRKG